MSTKNQNSRKPFGLANERKVIKVEIFFFPKGKGRKNAFWERKEDASKEPLRATKDSHNLNSCMDSEVPAPTFKSKKFLC